ncbi:N-acetylmuramoyl-L-alanine amidase [Saccharothrix variisporea]|uniref:N-acetyl-anhydromuramyl-L-alanine amidase AmpD n=1 Tax=Saccharothrix variisporea TaxID=543527 RepID=A0A495WZR8_9PSEU|nr:N-acetylmuramoyl-L-alanine amidase [Saccharothrix variisporea]RKT67120.1 N-acetyl-anhydromuramyl-L-alanine amidase AmpD [Saccharothrix variisporea]
MAPYSSARPGDPYFVTIHTGEGILGRFDMAAFLDGNPGASVHAASDAGGVVAPLVPYDRAAWTAGYTANAWGLHIELCAFAHMTRAQWLSESDIVLWIPWIGENRTVRSPMSMLRNSAAWVREVSNLYGIPARKIGAAELRDRVGGICGHADTSAAWGETDHTDPGPNFPWDVFIALVQGQEDDHMPEDPNNPYLRKSDSEYLAREMEKYNNERKRGDEFVVVTLSAAIAELSDDPSLTKDEVRQIVDAAEQQQTAELKAHIDATVADVDEQALADALAARGIGGASPAEVKAALAEVLRRGVGVS